MMKLITVVLLSIFVSACAYPIYKTLQPEASLTIKDKDGKPIEGAVVTLVSHSYPYGLEKTRMLVKSNGRGEADFPIIKQWRTESLMIHRSEVFVWNWCVVKEGFETFKSSYGRGSEFEAFKVIQLKPGKTTQCPEITKL
ncbi:MAG: carboxypeptidase regulatory-like domain-containing protein [Gammaproteobacteria bacterium]|nr:carboxypeptidase regulatory-like domain-containing protein [Gammaproteobacteria bacterium]